jgi:hypothetical protein
MMKSYRNGFDEFYEADQFTALAEIHRMIEAEAATPGARARCRELRVMIFGLCVLAVAALILMWLGV